VIPVYLLLTTPSEMASIFTFDPDPPRVSSPWSISETSTPQTTPASNRLALRTRSSATLRSTDHDSLSDYGISKLDPEPQEGPTEYKLHLLLRPRRLYTSMSTGHVVAGSYHSQASLSTPFPTTPSSYETAMKPQQTRSMHSRQERLQHLTTQLLWRLQQSSPFHSSTATNNLVLPVLPDKASESGPPQRPARLLPGLEESQGALYEIGVADDGTFVGLTQDELEESLSNLQIMAGSLGCKVDVLRRVVVGECEWEDDSVESHAEGLWVAEALVGPDLDYYHAAPTVGDASGATEKRSVSEDDHSSTEQIRVSLTGPSTAGKSSLLGTLTSSLLDNGRGKSRLSLLKHRHEISSGITSSVAQELIGYTADDSSGTVDVVNYASGNVAAWDDIHAVSTGGRLAFVSDLPGSVRFSKSMLRGLISWAPHYVILCIPANCDDGTMLGSDGKPAEQTTEIGLAVSYLELCIKLEMPILIAITRMDLASRAGLRNTLAKVLSVLKLSGKKPAMLPVSGSTEKVAGLQRVEAEEGGEVKKVVDAMADDTLLTVPIVLTSAVDGSGIQKLHAFLRYLPIPVKSSPRTIDLSAVQLQSPADKVFNIVEVFAIPPSKVYSTSSDQTPKENQGVVLCGLVRYGAISIGDQLVVGPLLANPHWQHVRVVSVRNLRLPVRKLTEDQVGTIGIEPTSHPDELSPHLGRIRKGIVLTSLSQPVPLHTGFVATFSTSEFASADSQPLLAGGNAIVYIANVRTAVKITCLKFDANEGRAPSSPTASEFVGLDTDPDHKQIIGESRAYRDGDVQNVVASTDAGDQENVHITFSFVMSPWCVEIGSKVLVMPNVLRSASSVPASGSGLEGFVGKVRETFSESHL